jgi:GAF domain-containing protein
VGAALSPKHGVTFADLFRHADEALYAAKRAGKCQYHLYSTQDAYQNLTESMAHTGIDSDEQPTMNDEGLIRFVFRQLYESRDIDATINDLLAFIGTQFNVSRTYIFENNEDNTTCSNTFEWCNEGISPEKDNLQNLSYLTDLVGWPDVYGESGVLYCADINDLEPHIRDIVEPQGIKSMLHCAIMDRGVFRGYVGFDECTANYLWTQTQVSTLQFLAEVLAVFLVKHRADRK